MNKWHDENKWISLTWRVAKCMRWIMSKTRGQLYFESLHGWGTLDAETQRAWQREASKLDLFSEGETFLAGALRKHFENNPTLETVRLSAMELVEQLGLPGMARGWGRYATGLAGKGLGYVRLLNGIAQYTFLRKDFGHGT